MAGSRTVLHAHWLSDVAAGAVLGAATGLLLYVAFRAMQPAWASRWARRASAS